MEPKKINSPRNSLTLDDILKTVDYAGIEDNYIPTTFAIKFINFIKSVNDNKGEENLSPIFHYKILDMITRFKKSLVVAFRGSSKTTITAEYLILYMAVFGELDGFGEVNIALYISDTMENGCKNLRNNIEHRYRNSNFLQKFIPTIRFTDARLEFTNVSGHDFCVRLFGVSTGFRGAKEYGKRPELAIFDDLLTDKTAASNTIVKDIEDVIYKGVVPALHPTKYKMIWIGTPFNKKDPLYKAAGSMGWRTAAFPICNKFPCSKEEFVGAWDNRFSYETVRELYELFQSQGKTEAFNQEYMLKILSEEDKLVRDEDIIWYRRNDVLDNLRDYNIYITTDFATSEKESADFSVIAVWALDYRGVFHWIDGIVEKRDMARNVDDIFRFVRLYNPLSVGVEISGQQKGFVSWLKRDMTTRAIWFTLASDKASKEEGLRPTTNKLVRFNTVLPLFKQRKVALPEDLRDSKQVIEIVDELTSVTHGGIKSLHDDCIDSISQLQLLEYFSPHDPSEMKKANVPIEISYDDSKYFRSNVPEATSRSSYIV